MNQPDLFESLGGLDTVAPVREEERDLLESTEASRSLFTAVYEDVSSLAAKRRQGAPPLEVLVFLEDVAKWYMGDLILERAREVKPMVAYREAAEAIGKSVRWALELRIVAEAFPARYRVAGVPWSVYRRVARDPDPVKSLVRLHETGWSGVSERDPPG